jgi:DNA-binding CsgD family transcriptional regulator
MKQIARVLNITARTVAFHKYGMMQELGIKTSAELVQFAVKQHLVSV